MSHCSCCGLEGHNARTCPTVDAGIRPEKKIPAARWRFGVRVGLAEELEWIFQNAEEYTGRLLAEDAAEELKHIKRARKELFTLLGRMTTKLPNYEIEDG